MASVNASIRTGSTAVSIGGDSVEDSRAVAPEQDPAQTARIKLKGQTVEVALKSMKPYPGATEAYGLVHGGKTRATFQLYITQGVDPAAADDFVERDGDLHLESVHTYKSGELGYSGLGTAALQFTLQRATELGSKRITTDASWSSHVFYSKRGFHALTGSGKMSPTEVDAHLRSLHSVENPDTGHLGMITMALDLDLPSEAPAPELLTGTYHARSLEQPLYREAPPSAGAGNDANPGVTVSTDRPDIPNGFLLRVEPTLEAGGSVAVTIRGREFSIPVTPELLSSPGNKAEVIAMGLIAQLKAAGVPIRRTARSGNDALLVYLGKIPWLEP